MAFHLQDFGSYTVGGRIAEVTEGTPERVQFTRTASYVQFYIPTNRNAEPPVILLHGGGVSGSCWDTTPNGRPGWLHLLLDRGYEVHVVDAPECGRAGFAPGHWDGTPMLRSMEEAWTLFRIGPAGGFATGTTHPGQKFPTAAFEAFARSFVPRWLTTTHLHVAAFLALLDRLGPSHVVCHSQGGETVFDAHAHAPQNFASIIALEPSGYPEDGKVLSDTPTHILAGDFLDTADSWATREAAWKALGSRYSGAARFGGGNTHMLMSDLNSAQVFEEAFG